MSQMLQIKFSGNAGEFFKKTQYIIGHSFNVFKFQLHFFAGETVPRKF